MGIGCNSGYRTPPVLLLVVLLYLMLATWTGFVGQCRASEFPERECCDPIYPAPEPTSRLPSALTPTGKSGGGRKIVMNCLFARKLCFEHQNCSAILKVIPRVCGPELVACSTVTVTKCQTALRSLQAFDFFKPTCLCKEPREDAECNSFRDFLFDHPCIYVIKKEKDPYAMDSLPTCNHALSVCNREKSCVKLYDDFKANCKTRDNRCRMENWDACHEAWTQLRLSPMFGCICPDNQAKKRCDRIFSMVNHNPCVEYQSSSIDLSGTDSALHPFEQTHHHHHHHHHNIHQQNGNSHEADPNYQELWLTPTSMYPYFLFPGTAAPRLSSAFYELDSELASDLEEEQSLRFQLGEEGQDKEDPDDADGTTATERPKQAGRPKLTLYAHSVPPELQDSVSAIRVFENDHWVTQWLHVWPHPRQYLLKLPTNPLDSNHPSSSLSHVIPHTSSQVPKHDREPPLPSTMSTITTPEHNNLSQHAEDHRHRHHHHNQHFRDRDPAPPRAPAQPLPTALAPPPRSTSTSVEHEPGGRKFGPYERVDDELLLPLDRLAEAFEGFVDSVNVISNANNTTTIELIESQMENPLIDADHQDLHALKQIPIPNVHHHHRVVHHKQRNQSHEDLEGGQAAPSPLSDNERIAQQPVKVVLTSTCHQAYSTCKSDAECKALLQPVLNHCEHSRCSRSECMGSLQHFYKLANHKHSIEIAFCLCRRSEGKHTKDECMMAQEKMHPTCALRVPAGSETPTCDTLGENCRKNPICRTKLEHYEQSCAIDSVTKKCAGPAQTCRTAMLGIIGTELRSNCVCRSADKKGVESTSFYECLGWQRLLWVNPCVVEAQKDFHARRNQHHNHIRPTISSIEPSPTEGISPRRPSLALPSPATPRVPLVAATSLGLAESKTEGDPTETGESEDNVIPEVQTVGQIQPMTEPTMTTMSDTTTTIMMTPMTTTMASTVTTSMATTTTTTTTTTTVAPTPSTPPPRYCIVQRMGQSHQYIRVGKLKRLYREDEPECSELCQCDENESATCSAICVETSPCKTDFAFYNHAAPAYQAYRGRCLCYSGRFICMRPAPEAYNIPHGVFMFLGYSETDENLLKPHHNLTVVDAVSSLDSFMREEVNNQTMCTIFLYNVTKENVIAVARLMTDGSSSNNVSQAQSLKHLLRVKEECASMLQGLSDKINNRHHEVYTHPLLSIFKMAEVEIKLPRASSATSSGASPLLFGLLLLILVRSPTSSS